MVDPYTRKKRAKPKLYDFVSVLVNILDPFPHRSLIRFHLVQISPQPVGGPARNMPQGLTYVVIVEEKGWDIPPEDGKQYEECCDTPSQESHL